MKTPEEKKKYNEYMKNYRLVNKEIFLLREKEYRDNNKDKIKIGKKIHYIKNKNTILSKNKEYQKTHELKDRTEYFKNYMKDYRKLYLSNPLNLLKKRVTTMILNSFKNKGVIKNTKTTEILGCSLNDFKIHLEAKFDDWMNWDNRGLYNGEFNYGWDIDHIIPLSSAKTIEDIIRLNHYTNLQPLCSKVNRDIKKDKH